MKRFFRKSKLSEKDGEILWDCWRYVQFANYKVRPENYEKDRWDGEPGLIVIVQWGHGELPASTQEWDRLPVRGAAAGHHQAGNNSEPAVISLLLMLSVWPVLSCLSSGHNQSVSNVSMLLDNLLQDYDNSLRPDFGGEEN